MTVKVDSGVARAAEDMQASAVRKERILRPLTDEEENYELFRVKKNAGSNLRIRGKQSIQTSRKQMDRRSSPAASYDQF
jgi:hypothetical protein